MSNKHNIFGIQKTNFFCTPRLVLSYCKHIFIMFFVHSELSPRLTLHYQLCITNSLSNTGNCWILARIWPQLN